MSLVEGPFPACSKATGRSRPVGEGGCRVDLVMRFAFKNTMSAMLFEPLFEQTAASLVDAFVRVLALLRPPSTGLPIGLTMAAGVKRCVVAYATRDEQWLWSVEFPPMRPSLTR